MATAELVGTLKSSEESVALAAQLRRLTRVATVIALLTSPAAFFWFHKEVGLGTGKAILVTAVCVIAFRGLVDLLIRRLIPWPSLFGTEDVRLREEDIVNRRRSWTWRFYFRVAIYLGSFISIAFLYRFLRAPAGTSRRDPVTERCVSPLSPGPILPVWAEKEAEHSMLLLVALAILALLAFGAGFVIHWLFIVAAVIALIWVINLFTGGLARGARR
jgi:hypothetical protein